MSVFSNREPRTPAVTNAYVHAVSELVGTRDPLEIIEATPAVLGQTLRETDPDLWRVAESPGKWSISGVLHHLADMELVWGYRLRRILAEPGPPLDGLDQDEWATRFGYGQADPMDSLQWFTALRKFNLWLIRRLGPEDLTRTAVHAERGEADLGRLIRHNAGHDLMHVRQINRIREAVTT